VTHEILDAAEYALYRFGWTHAPMALSRVEEWGHRVRNRPLRWRRIACRMPDGASLSIDLVGWDEWFAAYLMRLLARATGGVCNVVDICTARAREMDPRRAQDAGADAIFVEVPDWKTAPWADHGFFVVPKRVSHVESLAVPDGRRASELRHAAAKLGLTMRISRAAKDLEQFYRSMYLPMVASRHGDLGRPTKLSVLRMALRWGSLVQVFMHNEWVSGALVAESPFDAGALQILVIGVRGGDYVAVPDGARGAPVLFARDFGRARGFRVCDHLVSPPFPLDGLFRRKQRWGAAVQDIPQRRDRLVLRIARDSSAMRVLLSEMPFIATGMRGLRAIVSGRRRNTGDAGELAFGGVESISAPDQADLVGSLGQLARSLMSPTH